MSQKQHKIRHKMFLLEFQQVGNRGEESTGKETGDNEQGGDFL